jgi:hypothetical protein
MRRACAKHRTGAIHRTRFLIAAIALTSLGSVALAQPAGTEASPDCVDVYVVHPQPWIASPTSYTEVATSIDGQPFVVRGKLPQHDWGAFVACGTRLTFRLRLIDDIRSIKGPRVSDKPKTATIELRGRSKIYFGLGKWKFKEVPPADAEEEIAFVNKRRRPGGQTVWSAPAAGWEWEDRRELVYGPGTMCALEKSERCP